jgi:pSer/pThr/pTyr-binding forkhead associated (FHA) protein
VAGFVFVEQRPVEGREVEAAPDAVIGRTGCDIVLADSQVSRRHAAIRLIGQEIAIEDLGSTNGTFVNDERISGVRQLRDGDVVAFGDTVWRLRAPARAAPPPPVAPAPPPAAGQAGAFAPVARHRGGSQATRVEATVVCLLIVVADAIAVIAYLAAQ